MQFDLFSFITGLLVGFVILFALMAHVGRRVRRVRTIDAISKDEIKQGQMVSLGDDVIYGVALYDSDVTGRVKIVRVDNITRWPSMKEEQ